jgi:predicted AlkP superfamily phosphohydrolase/phosphomutase
MSLAKTDVDGYYKNIETNVVINNNNVEYETFIQNRERMRQIQTLQNDIEKLKNEFGEIKEICKKISERFNVKTNQ